MYYLCCQWLEVTGYCTVTVCVFFLFFFFFFSFYFLALLIHTKVLHIYSYILYLKIYIS